MQDRIGANRAEIVLPWKWAKRKSNYGGWFYITRRFPLELLVGVETLARWQNKRAANRGQNAE
jgi:hypothetical protein